MIDDEGGRAVSGTGGRARATLCSPFIDGLPISGAAMSTLGNLMAPETVCASDTEAAHLDELQFDLGEGPCWDAVATQNPVIECDVRDAPSGSWPAFIEAVQSTPVRAMFAFPLSLGPMHLGVVDLYRRVPGELAGDELDRALVLATTASRMLLRRVLSTLGDADDDEGEYSRRRFHQATGAVIAQLGVTPEDAALIVRAHAFATGKRVAQVADELLSFELDFSKDESDS